jgi:hypothetical protein
MMAEKEIVLYGVDENGQPSVDALRPRGGSLPFGFEGETIYDFWQQAELDIPEDLRVAFATDGTTFAASKWDLSRPEYQTPEILANLADRVKPVWFDEDGNAVEF